MSVDARLTPWGTLGGMGFSFKMASEPQRASGTPQGHPTFPQTTHFPQKEALNDNLSTLEAHLPELQQTCHS